MSVAINVTLFMFDGKQQENHIVDLLLTDYVIESFLFERNQTFDELFHKCAQKCGITPLYLPLFALRDKTSNWVNLANSVDEYLKERDQNKANDSHYNVPLNDTAIEVEFRLRFTFRSEGEIDGEPRQAHRYSAHDLSHKPVMNETVIRYLFHQRHADFLKGKLPLKEDLSDPTGAALGVAVLDLLRLACEMKCSLDTTFSRLHNYKKLLPTSCKDQLRSMNFCNRLRVKLKFKHYLNHFTPNSSRWLNSDVEAPPKVSYFYCRYLRNLELVVCGSSTETYKLVPEKSSTEVKEITIGADCGIVKGKDENGEQWCDFHSIADMKIQTPKQDENVWIVSISKLNGNILQLALGSSFEVENIASCINGYYMLLTDAHHYLCESVTAPSVVERLALDCHGPVSSSFAESCIRDQQDTHIGDCFLRQSQESPDEYFINTVIEAEPLDVRNYKLNRSETGMLGIFGDENSHNHLTLRALLDDCNERNNASVPFFLNRLIVPSSKNQSSLKIYRCSDKHCIDNGFQGISKEQSNAVIIRENVYNFDRVLGTGKYTTVILYQHKELRNHQVVMKKVYDPQEAHELGVKQSVEESFQESMCVQNFLNSDHIVQQIGTMKNMMVLEYMPYGSITTYLQSRFSSDSSRQETISYGWFLQVLWQLASACNYLEHKDIPHGNIRGKNVLLWQAEPQPHVKLADAGPTTHIYTTYRQVPVQMRFRGGNSTTYPVNIQEPLLQAPWLAYEFCWIEGDPTSSKFVSNAGDKWSYATTACEICESGCLSVNPCTARKMSEELKHGYLTGNVMSLPEILSNSKAISKLIKLCWSIYAQRRPSFKKILRELGAVLASDYVLPSITPYQQNGKPHEDQSSKPKLQTFQDVHLIHMQQLGHGHFGHVDLYRYDPPNGVALQVAVKSLHRSLNTPSRDSEFNNEIETMRLLNHKHIVKLLGIAEPSLRIVMEYLVFGSLLAHMKREKSNHTPIQNLHKQLLTYSNQIAQGMIALQQRRLVHRDLALRNILLAQDNRGESMYVKISDFGLSRILKDRTYYPGNPNEIPAQWYAPECFRNGKTAFRFESDIWSYGVTIWEMFSYGNPPKYESLPAITQEALYQTLRGGQRLPKPDYCPERVYIMMRKCWELEPSNRPSFATLRDTFSDISNELYPH